MWRQHRVQGSPPSELHRRHLTRVQETAVLGSPRPPGLLHSPSFRNASPTTAGVTDLGGKLTKGRSNTKCSTVRAQVRHPGGHSDVS